MAEPLRFHACIYARPAATRSAGGQSIASCPAQPLVAAQQDLLSAFPLTFDAAAEALAQLPRMFLEPDGSFVWVSSAGEPAWQIDGMLHDRGPALAYVELKGTCPPASLDMLLACFGWPATPLIFQLVREGVLLDEVEFRRVAAAMGEGRSSGG